MDHHGLRLSVVATSRNDDHGANLRRRMQTFVNAFIGQCQRHDLHAELILVEWNPPADKPRLAEALHWPADPSPCEVRIIEVPEALHRRLAHAEALPLFQMIAKNVGIRRARGRFILATNIDILFNDELMRFLKEGPLEQGKIYRIDRTDVETDVPVSAAVEEQLAFCRHHQLRINSAHGTIPVDSEGVPVVAKEDIAARDSGLVPLEGASPAERDAEGQLYRWAGGNVYLMVGAPKDGPRRLLVDLAPGPSVRRLPVEMELYQGDDVVARGQIQGRTTISVALPLAPNESKVFCLRAVEGGYFPPPPPDTRMLDFALYRLSWSEGGDWHPVRDPEDAFQVLASHVDPQRDIFGPSADMRLDGGWYDIHKRTWTRYRWANHGASLILDRPTGPGLRLRMWVAPGPNFRKNCTTTLQLRDEQDRPLGEVKLTGGSQGIDFPVPPAAGSRCVYLHVQEDGVALPRYRAIQALRVYYCAWSDAPLRERLWAAFRAKLAGWGLRCRDLFSAVAGVLPRRSKRRQPWNWDKLQGYRLPRLHTNACGDFTLLAREDWSRLGAYSELAMYSMHIDSLLLFQGYYAGLEEVILDGDERAYHIEHSAGSGWTPEGQNDLYQRLQSRGIPVLTWEEVHEMVHRMATQNNPRLFNSDNWGLAEETLPETRIAASRQVLAA